MPAKCPLTNIPRGVMRPLIYSFQLTEKYHVTYHVTYQIKKGCFEQVKSVKIPNSTVQNQKRFNMGQWLVHYAN